MSGSELKGREHEKIIAHNSIIRKIQPIYLINDWTIIANVAPCTNLSHDKTKKEGIHALLNFRLVYKVFFQGKKETVSYHTLIYSSCKSMLLRRRWCVKSAGLYRITSFQ